MSSSVAAFDDGLAHHDWSRQPQRNGDSRSYNAGQTTLPPQSPYDTAQSWNQMPAVNQMPSFNGQTSTPFSAYQPPPTHLVSPSASEFPQSRTQMGVQQYQQQSGAYAPHERPQLTQTPYVPPSDHPQSSPIDSSATAPHYARHSYDTARPMYPGDSYSSSPSGNLVYGAASSSIQSAPPPLAAISGSTYEQQSVGADPNYGYVTSNANSLAYADPIAPQPQRPRADFTQVSEPKTILSETE